MRSSLLTVMNHWRGSHYWTGGERFRVIFGLDTVRDHSRSNDTFLFVSPSRTLFLIMIIEWISLYKCVINLALVCSFGGKKNHRTTNYRANLSTLVIVVLTREQWENGFCRFFDYFSLTAPEMCLSIAELDTSCTPLQHECLPPKIGKGSLARFFF